MNRTQVTLAGLLLIQAILILLLRSPFSGGATPAQAQLLLPQLEVLSATRLEFLGEDDEALTLKRQGHHWAVEQLGGFPVDSERVDEFLDDLRQLEVGRPVVSSSRYHEAFNITDEQNEGRVKIWGDGDDEPQVDLILGNSPNYRISHARLAGQDRVYEVRGLAPYNISANATSWVDKQLVDVPTEQLVGLTLTNPTGSFELVKQDESWSVRAADGYTGQALDADKLQQLLRAATAIRIDTPIGPIDEAAHGLDDPAATLVLRWIALELAATGEGESPPPPEEQTVRIGDKLPDKETQRYATRSGFEFTGAVWESSISKLLEQELDDLLASE